MAERLRQAEREPARGRRAADGAGLDRPRRSLHVVGRLRTRRRRRAEIAGRPGFQPDGSYLTPEGERLTDDVSQAGLPAHGPGLDHPARSCARSRASPASTSIGGYEKQFVVEPDPSRLAAYGVSFSELAEALERANISVGANFIERGGEAFLVRADARIRIVDEIGRTRRRHARRRAGHGRATSPPSASAASCAPAPPAMNGHEVVIGTALMLAGENSRTVAEAVAERLERGRRDRLPPGVKVTPVYDRSALVDATIAHGRAEPRRRRAAGRSPRCSGCSATSAPRSSPRWSSRSRS